MLDSDKGLVEDFIRYAARKGVAPDYRDIARSRKLIEAPAEAYIGRNTALEDNASTPTSIRRQRGGACHRDIKRYTEK